MIYTVIIAILTCISLILSIIFFPKIKVFNKQINTYWLIGLLGATLMLLFGSISVKDAFNGLFSDSSINPIKILILFISMTLLSVFLDEVGFFKTLAMFATKKAKSNQKALFFILYAVVSILTIFTSNDIVILTFTPFICYFAKNTKINPIPYLVAEFVGADTWSMMLIIGNPTNIFLATSANIEFIEYLKIMFIPTLLAGICEILVLYILFNKKLKEPLVCEYEEQKFNEKTSIIIGLAHLLICLVLLVISSYINIPMYLICLCCAISLVLLISVINIISKKKFSNIKNTFKRIPYDLCPFVLSMFVLVITLKNQGILLELSTVLSKINNDLYSYGVSSFVCSNFMNNIPMSVMFSEMIVSSNASTTALYATVIGSNLGAYLTPLGALAGIMWLGLLKNEKVEMSFGKFIIYTGPISLIAMCVSLLLLGFVL